jgi:hypothetical protein
MKSNNPCDLTANDMNRIAEESRRQADSKEYIDIKERIFYMAYRGKNGIFLEKRISDYTKTLLDQEGFVVTIERIPDAYDMGCPAYSTTIQW